MTPSHPQTVRDCPATKKGRREEEEKASQSANQSLALLVWLRLRRRSSIGGLCIDGKLGEGIDGHAFEGALIGSAQDDLGDLWVGIARARVKGLLPAAHAQAPLAAVGQAGLAQVVAPGSAEVEELVCHDACM